MKKIFLLAALGLSMMASAVEMDYYKTLVDEQATASAGQTQLYSLEYATDGSMYLLSSYQTASAEEVGLHFEDKTYQGATAKKWGSKTGELKVQNMRNSFLAKLDAEGNLLWAKADTTGDYDLSNSALAVTAEGGVIYADKFRTRKGVYMGFMNMYNAAGNLLATNNMAFTSYDSIEVDGQKVARKEAFSWAGIAQDANGFVYFAGLQGDTLVPTWSDSIAPRKAWNTKGSLSSNCNTFICKYRVDLTKEKLVYVGAVINNDELDYDRPLGLHYENGKLYIAGTYGKGAEQGIYAACYNTNLEREFIEYHPIAGSLQFQQTKFDDGKIFVCGGVAKGSVTVGEKTIATTGNFNHGLVYIMNQADGATLDFDVHAAANNALNITVAAYPTKDGYVAYNHETLNGIQIAFTYDKDMNLVKADTLGQGGGSSTINAVGRSVLRDHTLVGLRARTTGDYYLLDKDTLNFAGKTNWYSLVAALNTESDKLPEKDTIQVDGLYYELNNIARTATLIRLNASFKYEIEDIIIPVYVSKEGRSYPVVALGQAAFAKATSSSITFAEGSQVKTLGMQAFQAAVNLEEIELPEGVQLIPMTCFNNATASNPTKTKKVVLPASIDSIARLSFSLPQLDTLEFKGALPPRINTFTVASSGYVQNPWEVNKDHANNTKKAAVVVVPKGALEAYKNTAWIGDYFDTIVERKAPYLEATTIAEFNAAEDGELVKLTLTDAKVTAYADLQDVYYVEDATAATVISGAELTVGTALNGYIVGTKSTNVVDYINDPSEAVEPMMTAIDTTRFVATETTLTPTVMTIAEACAQANYARLITIENLTATASGKNQILTDEANNIIRARDLFGILTLDYEWPEAIESITGICLYYMNGWFIIPTSEEGIVAKEEQGVEDIEVNGKAVKFLENGQLYIRYNGRTYNVLGL
jgi:hypothetical protein